MKEFQQLQNKFAISSILTRKTIFFVFLLVSFFTFAQSAGDFRTKVPQSASQNWITVSAWETFNGTSWVPATQYPGQTSGNYKVTVSAQTSIFTSLPTISIGTLVIEGFLQIDADLTLPTTSVLQINAGTLYLNGKKRQVRLAANTKIEITGYTGTNGIQSSDCNNNVAVFIGSVKYAACTGSGNTTVGDFSTINENGGSLKAEPLATPNAICSGESVNITATANTVTDLTYKWQVVSAPPGYSLPSGNSTAQFLGTMVLTLPGTYTFRYTVSKNSTSVSGDVTIQVYAKPDAGTISGVNLCSKYGNNTVTLTGHTGNIVKWQSSPTSDFSSGVVDIAETASQIHIGSLQQNLFYRALIANGTCSVFSPVAAVTVSATAFEGNQWSNGLPDITKRIVIYNDYSFSGDVQGCALEVVSGAKVTVPGNSSLTLDGEIEVISGTFTVDSDAGLIQKNDNAQNTGNITVKRQSRMKRLDYTLWGAPVAQQNLFGFSPQTLTNRFYLYNETDDTFNTNGLTSSTVFVPGKGYLVRSPNNFPSTYSETSSANLFTGVFTGKPNNGTYAVTLQKQGQGYNLVGNPYPSNIDFDQLYLNNSAAIENTAYFWTNVNPANAGGEYIANNYAQYVGGTGNPATNGTQIPTNIIKTGQGFLVQAKTDGAVLQFNNNIRTERKTGIFFNVAHHGVSAAKDRFWLKLTSPLGNSNSLAIVYTEGAKDQFDAEYDGKLRIIGSDSFYSVVDEHKLAIQGRSYPLKQDDKVQIGFVAYQDGIHTVSLAGKEGIFNDGNPVYLHDKVTGVYKNLQEGDYQFSAEKGSNDTRFEIVYQNKTVLSVNPGAREDIIIYKDGADVVVKSSEKIVEVQLYDLSGKLVYRSNANGNELRVENRSAPGVFILKVVQKGKITVKKVRN